MKKFFKDRFLLQNFQLFDIIIFAMLIALGVVFDRFLAFKLWNTKISFAFLPIALIAYRYGCSSAIIVAALIDFIGAILLPFGPYFFGFTLINAISGLIFGLFLYKNSKMINIISAALINGIICTLILNTLCISVLYDSEFVALIISRIPQFILIIVAQILTFRYLYVFDLAVKRLPIKQQSR